MKQATGPNTRFRLPTNYIEKIITGEGDVRCLGKGWYWSDLHVHTSCSSDVLPVSSSDPLRMYERARELGLAYVSFTDHDTMAAYDRLGWEREGLVPGAEIRILDRKRVGHTVHVNVYLLDMPLFLEAEEIARKKCDLEYFLQFLNENDLPHTYNHPFWFEAGEEPTLSAVPEIARLFPVLEYNRGRVLPLNRLTLGLAERYAKGIVCCSDTHTQEGMGTARTCARGETFREYFDSIRDGEAYLLTRDLTVPGLIDEVNEWIHQIFGPDLDEPAGDILEASLGVKHLNWLLHSLRGGVLASNPWLRPRVERFFQAVSSSGVIQELYVNAQESRAQRIQHFLEAA